MRKPQAFFDYKIENAPKSLFSVMPFSYQHEGNYPKVFECALDTIGVSKEYICWLYERLKGEKLEIDSFEISVEQAFFLGQVLGISLDFLSYGYCKRMHIIGVARLLEKGEYYFPLNENILYINEARKDHDYCNYKSELRMTGNPLRERVKKNWLSNKDSDFSIKQRLNFYKAYKDYCEFKNEHDRFEGHRI